MNEEKFNRLVSTAKRLVDEELGIYFDYEKQDWDNDVSELLKELSLMPLIRKCKICDDDLETCQEASDEEEYCKDCKERQENAVIEDYEWLKENKGWK